MKCLIFYSSDHEFDHQQINNFYVNKKSSGKIKNVKIQCYNPTLPLLVFNSIDNYFIAMKFQLT